MTEFQEAGETQYVENSIPYVLLSTKDAVKQINKYNFYSKGLFHNLQEVIADGFRKQTWTPGAPDVAKKNE